jgi:hypothetical protein
MPPNKSELRRFSHQRLLRIGRTHNLDTSLCENALVKRRNVVCVPPEHTRDGGQS